MTISIQCSLLFIYLHFMMSSLEIFFSGFKLKLWMGCKLHILLAGDDIGLFILCDKHMVIISIGSILLHRNIHVSVKLRIKLWMSETVGLIWQPFKHVKNANRIVPHNYDD